MNVNNLWELDEINEINDKFVNTSFEKINVNNENLEVEFPNISSKF